jgi:large subunit ribosomal protein L17
VNALTQLFQEGPNTSLSWLLWVVLLLFLLIVLIGWWVSRNKGSQPTVQPKAHAEPAMPVVQEKKAPDDLTVLEGIGPKVAKVLNDIGIMTFADLAGADLAKVQQALNAAGMRYMNPAGWVEQAKLAASGDMEGLKKLQGELQGGRRAN